MKASSQARLGDVFSYLFMAVMFVFFASPLIWLLSLALRTRKEIYLGVARLIPHNPTLENFEAILSSSQFASYLINALKLSCLSAIGCLIVALPAAYAFSRFEIRGKGAWLMGLPDSLDEAAMIDGCSRFGVFWRVILPLSTPGIASVFIITVIAGWSQFLVPFLLITKDNLMPIGVGIFQYAGTQNDSSLQVLAAACLVSVVPAIIAFLSLQRLILSAMTAGAVKG